MARDAKTVVYFLTDFERGAVKIGFSCRPFERLGVLQMGHPYPIVPLGSCPGGRELEAALHEEFADHRLIGEWFRTSDALLKRIKGLCQDWSIWRHRARAVDKWARKNGLVPPHLVA